MWYLKQKIKNISSLAKLSKCWNTSHFDNQPALPPASGLTKERGKLGGELVLKCWSKVLMHYSFVLNTILQLVISHMRVRPNEKPNGTKEEQVWSTLWYRLSREDLTGRPPKLHAMLDLTPHCIHHDHNPHSPPRHNWFPPWLSSSKDNLVTDIDQAEKI